ncbi:alpha/beta fold hydrolase [Falsiroseomonas bella]|nr:alpha/beta fold hydrolase [Falsiroseomonas bella]
MIEAVAALPDTSLAYWDTGGPGEPVLLLHPGTGSLEIWEHQRPALAAAGYRAIGYSRRGHRGSDPGSAEAPGTGSGDLAALLDHLGIARCHLVGAAAGGIVALDFALSRADRLISLTLSCSILGIADPDYAAVSEGLRPPGFAAMPPEFRELGPSYRAANPAGVASWLELEHRAIPGRQLRQPTANRITFAALRALDLPCLLMTGDADLWIPPSLLRQVATHVPRAETRVIAECGHSAHWEQPAAFNAALLDFLGRYPAA